jgi:hypothetical protein
MNIETTSIRDKGVNLYHSDLRKMLVLVDYPDFLKKYETLYITFICLRDEVHDHDSYMHDGKPYISIALDYDSVVGIPFEQLTVTCKNQLISYLFGLSYLPIRTNG